MRSLLIGLVTLLAGSPAALAGIPSAATSQVDPCIITCPAGDSMFVGIVRHADFVPYHEDAPFVLDLCGCPGVVLGPIPAGDDYSISGCVVQALTDFNGTARIPIAAGGICSGATLQVTCDNVPLATRTSVASFDQDGDLVVDAGDLALVDGKLGTSDPTADFDCDGVVGASDHAIAAAHLGHHATVVTGVGTGQGVEFGARPAPNPSAGAFDFTLRFPDRGRAVLSIHDLTGRRITTVLDREIQPGVQHASWSGRDTAGRPMASGLYFYRLMLGSRRSQGLLIVTR